MPLPACLCQEENTGSKPVFFSRVILIFPVLRRLVRQAHHSTGSPLGQHIMTHHVTLSLSKGDALFCCHGSTGSPLDELTTRSAHHDTSCHPELVEGWRPLLLSWFDELTTRRAHHDTYEPGNGL